MWIGDSLWIGTVMIFGIHKHRDSDGVVMASLSGFFQQMPWFSEQF